MQAWETDTPHGLSLHNRLLHDGFIEIEKPGSYNNNIRVSGLTVKGKIFLQSGGYANVALNDQASHQSKEQEMSLQIESLKTGIEAANSQIEYNKSSLRWSKIATWIAIISLLASVYALLRS